MPGRPVLRKLSAAIDLVGEDAVFLRIANGDPMRAVAEALGCSRGLLYVWIEDGGEERREKFRHARKIAAHSHAEDAGEVLDKASSLTSADVSLAVARSNYRKWLAGVSNREDYGDKPSGPLVNISVGDLHLSALEKYGRVEHTRLPPTIADIEDAEISEM